MWCLSPTRLQVYRTVETRERVTTTITPITDSSSCYNLLTLNLQRSTVPGWSGSPRCGGGRCGGRPQARAPQSRTSEQSHGDSVGSSAQANVRRGEGVEVAAL